MAFWNKKKSVERKEPTIDIKEDEKVNSLDISDGLADAGFSTDEKARQYVVENAVQCEAPKIKNTGNVMDSCSGASAQYTANYDTANPHVLAYFIRTSGFIGHYACAVLAQNKMLSKGCSMKAVDAVKNGWDVTVNDGTDLDSKQINLINKADKKYKLAFNMVEAVKFNNIFGVRHVLFKHKDKNFDYEKPFNPDSFKNGNYEGMAQIDPYWMTPVIETGDLSDPTSIEFYNPTFWQINERKYHRSHFVILRGDDVADYLKPTYRYGGVPLIQTVYERLYAAERTANEGPLLAMTKRTQVRKTDLAKAQANKEQFVNNLKTANDYQDNYGFTVIGTDEDITQIDTSLADLDNVIMTQYQLACALFGVPATKMLGTTPKGFSSGDGENDMYLEDVEAVQGNEMNEIAQAHYARLIPSSLGKDLGVADLEIELAWRPLKITSDLEKSTIRVNNSTADSNWVQTGAISSYDVAERLVKDKESGFNGIELPDDDEGAEDE